MKEKLILGLAFAATCASSAALSQVGFDTWDEDADGFVTENEWGPGFEEAGLFDTWDENDDGFLDNDEWGAGFEDSGVFGDDFAGNEVGFDDWDANNDDLLDEEETSQGLYDTYNENENEGIEEPELADFNDDMGDAGFWDV